MCADGIAPRADPLPAGGQRGGGSASGASLSIFLGSRALAAMIVALAIAQQAAGHLNGDDSWFILFAERVANGAKAYVDISDPNPPAGFLAYMPAVRAARWLGGSAEFWTVVETFLAAFCSLALSGAILRATRTLAPDETGLWRNAALWLVLLAAGFGFAEREHFALIAFLPFAAAAMARAEGARPPLALAFVAGLGGGIALCFKPYFALPIAAVVLFAGWRRRAPSTLFAPENFAVAATAVVYGLFVWLRYPDYVWGVAALATEVYAPARYGFWQVAASPPFLFNAAALVAVGVGMAYAGFEARAALLAAASAGFLATYVIQAKIWFNHAYPGEALGVLALVALVTGRLATSPEAASRLGRMALLPALILAPFLMAAQMNLPGAEEYPGLTAAVRANAPARPKIAVLAQQLDVGHPLTRRVGGRWIGRRNALWVDNCVRQILSTQKVDEETRARLLAYAAEERAELAEDVAKGKPDILLVETPQLRQWAQGKPEFAHLLDGLVRKAQVGDIEIWARAGG